MEGVHFVKDGVHEEKIVFMSGEGLLTFQQCSLEACWEQVWSMLKQHSRQMESMLEHVLRTSREVSKQVRKVMSIRRKVAQGRS